MQTNMKRNLGFLAVGVAAGAAAALLLAPKSGRETRSDLRSQAGRLGDRGRGYWRRFRDRNQVTVPSIWEEQKILTNGEVEGPYPHS